MPVALFEHILYNTPATACGRKWQPAADLQEVIDCFLLMKQPCHSSRQFIFNDGIPALVFLLNGDGTIFSAWLSAQYLERSYLPLQQAAELLVMRFTGTGAGAVLQQPLSLLRRQPYWSLEELWGEAGVSLCAALNQVSAVSGKTMLLENFVRAKRSLRERAVHTVFRRAMQLLQPADGLPSVEQLCRVLQVNYKRLERSFAGCLGITPKEYMRLQRFLHAYFHLLQTNGRDLMGTAVAHGYYDQNHFTKEFKLFTGQAPLAYLRSLRADGYQGRSY